MIVVECIQLVCGFTELEIVFYDAEYYCISVVQLPYDLLKNTIYCTSTDIRGTLVQIRERSLYFQRSIYFHSCQYNKNRYFIQQFICTFAILLILSTIALTIIPRITTGRRRRQKSTDLSTAQTRYISRQTFEFMRYKIV